MTDPQNPAPDVPQASPPVTPPPAAQQPYAAAPPPAPAYTQPQGDTYPGKTLGVVALVLSCIFFLGISVLVGLILGIVALVQSKNAGRKNGPALAAVIVASVLIVLGIIIGVIVALTVIPAAAELARQCLELGPGTHTLSNGITITCGSN